MKKLFLTGIVVLLCYPAEAVECNREIGNQFNAWVNKTTSRGNFVLIQPEHRAGVAIAREISEGISIQAVSSAAT